MQAAVVVRMDFALRVTPQDDVRTEPMQGRDAAPLDDEYPRLGSFERLLRDYKVKLAMKAIEDCNGNKTLAARSLDISRAYLHRLIRLSGQVDTADVA